MRVCGGAVSGPGASGARRRRGRRDVAVSDVRWQRGPAEVVGRCCHVATRSDGGSRTVLPRGNGLAEISRRALPPGNGRQQMLITRVATWHRSPTDPDHVRCHLAPVATNICRGPLPPGNARPGLFPGPARAAAAGGVSAPTSAPSSPAPVSLAARAVAGGAWGRLPALTPCLVRVPASGASAAALQETWPDVGRGCCSAAAATAKVWTRVSLRCSTRFQILDTGVGALQHTRPNFGHGCCCRATLASKVWTRALLPCSTRAQTLGGSLAPLQRSPPRVFLLPSAPPGAGGVSAPTPAPSRQAPVSLAARRVAGGGRR